MKKILTSFFLLTIILSLFQAPVCGQEVEQLNASNRSLTYDQAIALYKKMALSDKRAVLTEEGQTDSGRPLHLFVLSSDGNFDPRQIRKQARSVVLINNGIHPGEPDGIDASVRLAQNYLSGKIRLPANTVIAIIPVLNIDGSLNQGCCTRANQNGPINQGFRGNARNLDLNRDFIKCDSENALSFTRIFQKWDPDVFIDTHVSNGADYQYTMTLISTQHNKLGGLCGEYLKKEMTPSIFSSMKAAGFEISPYVNTSQYDAPPESGIYGFMETPRFASGYAALFSCLGFVSETHMLKPFPQRVDATLKLLETIITYTEKNGKEIQNVRSKTRELIKSMNEFPLKWMVDTSRWENLLFKGYEAVYRTSRVTGNSQLYYDQNKPFEKEIRFYDHYVANEMVSKPKFYVLPQAWKEVIERLKLNGVQMTRLINDTTIRVTRYIIRDFKTVSQPYEGHYLHHSVETEREVADVNFLKGDYLIELNQTCNRYVIETLEPTAPDSWFAWGFFDSILQQKEWFSGYVFDEMAFEILSENPELKKQFEERKSTDKEFAESSFNQLYFIYQNSDYFESYRRYPVCRIE
jgi:hypothetical protein